jgi:type II secretory pathway component PulJ
VTLTELLVALTIFALVATATVTLLDEGQRVWSDGAARAETQQSARVALARLAGEVRNAGRGGIHFDAVALAEPDRIVLQQDLDGDGLILANGERVTWRLAGTILRRDAGGGAGAQPVINGVRALTLSYFDEADLATATASAVRSVEIRLITEPDFSGRGSRISTVMVTRVRVRNR